MVCTHGGRFRARSRSGWNMTAALPELERTLQADAQLDGELVALDSDGRPDFHRLGERMLQGRARIPVVEALFQAVCDRGLEGVVAKRTRDLYRPGERGWVKQKNRATARFAEERDGVGRRIPPRAEAAKSIPVGPSPS